MTTIYNAHCRLLLAMQTHMSAALVLDQVFQ